MKNALRGTDIISWRFVRFCLVGLANSLVDFCAFSLSLWLGVIPGAARTVSWFVAGLFSYLVNRRWTFKAADTGAAPLARFAVVNAASLGLGVVLLYVFKSLGFGNQISFLLSLPFTTAANYLGYRFWTFRQIR